MIIDSREQIYRATYMQIMRRWYFEEKVCHIFVISDLLQIFKCSVCCYHYQGLI